MQYFFQDSNESGLEPKRSWDNRLQCIRRWAKGPAWCLQYCSTAWFPEGILHRTVPVGGLDFWFWLDWAILPCWKFNVIKCLAGVYHAMPQGTFQLWLQGLCSLVRWSVLQFDSVKTSLWQSQHSFLFMLMLRLWGNVSVEASFINPEDPHGNPIFLMICPSHQVLEKKLFNIPQFDVI